ncbi:MAG: cyclic-di-AMP receptor [Ruminiclostridium sp.]|nr:cyclic-di-AMP receptor [Ruminiclostridium sp.]
MKLIFAIVNNDDAHNVSTALTRGGYSATKLASTGGFLMAGNTTFMICCENAAVDGIIASIAQNSRRRKQYVPNAASVALSAESAPASYPVEVSVGGATVFVTDIERFEKL